MLVTEVISTSVIRVIHYTGGAETPDGEGAANFTAAASFSTVFGIGAGNEGVGVVAEEIIRVEPEDLKSLELLQYPDDIKTFPAHMSIRRARDQYFGCNISIWQNTISSQLYSLLFISSLPFPSFLLLRFSLFS